MRAFACALAASLLAAPGGAEARGGAASLNLCTDELLLLLAAPAQVASVTYLSQDPLDSPLWRSARRYRGNDGSLLSIAAETPALVIDMGGGGRDTPEIARRLGIRTLLLPYPQTLRDVEKSIAAVAGALGRTEQGRLLIGRIEQLRLASPARRTDTIWLGGGGESLAPDGLGAEWMRLAGLRQRPLAASRVTLEELALHRPAILLRSDYRSGQYSSQQHWLSHPLVAHGGWKTVRTDGRRWTCMGPMMIGEIARLRRETGR
ncbi:MAG: hypothetical protein ACM3YM_00495 [Sphingomonadales bacterium]